MDSKWGKTAQICYTTVFSLLIGNGGKTVQIRSTIVPSIFIDTNWGKNSANLIYYSTYHVETKWGKTAHILLQASSPRTSVQPSLEGLTLPHVFNRYIVDISNTKLSHGVFGNYRTHGHNLGLAVLARSCVSNE